MFRTKSYCEARLDGVYFERDPTTLLRDHVDPELWDAVQAVNQSVWTWTRYCCQGHWDYKADEYASVPYLQVVCRNEDLGRIAHAATHATSKCIENHPSLRTTLAVTPASPNWASCTFHVYDAHETSEATLEAAREIVITFALALTPTHRNRPPVQLVTG